MMAPTKIYHALQGVRGRRPVNLEELENILVRFSNLVMEQPWIKEIDINPLLASSERIIALDARVLLHDKATDLANVPKTAIRPYPIQYVGEWKTKKGNPVSIRPIRPEDETAMIRFHEKLSERSVYLRYLKAISINQRTDHRNLIRNCYIDYDREMAIVAENKNEIVGVGRLRKDIHAQIAHLSVVVTDETQGQGIGTYLSQKMVEVARDEKIKLIRADILKENVAGINMLQSLGFVVQAGGSSELTVAELVLNDL
jgi:acetyltransferase